MGDKIGVAGEGPQRNMTVSGIAKFGSVDSIGGATFAVFDVPTAQKLLDKEGQFDVIYVTPKSGVSEAEVADQVKPLLPSSAQIETGDAAGDAAASEVNDGLAFFQYLLLAFAGIALIVGSFVIFNTLSMTVAQRVRELATLRTLGASRKQVFRSVLLEGFVTGLFAAIVGLLFGLLIAKGLNALFKALRGRPAQHRHRVQPQDGDRLAAARRGHHGARHDLAGAARHPRAADRGRARGRDAADVAARQEPDRRSDRAGHRGRPAGRRSVRRPVDRCASWCWTESDASSCSSASA